MFAWDADQDPSLMVFRIFVSKTSGVYALDKPPAAEIPEVGQWITTEPCGEVHLRDPGTYYFTIYAVDTSGLMSPPSPEVRGCIDQPGGTLHPC